MIYLLYTNSDKIEGKGHRILLGVSTDLDRLKRLSDSIPLSMGGKCPECEIWSYETDKVIEPSQISNLNTYPPKKIIHRFSSSNRWFDSYSDYENHLRSTRNY